MSSGTRLGSSSGSATSGLVRNAIILGLLSAIGPFAIDMYLPALPTIATDLRAETGAVQMSLLAFFIALAIAQLFCGPLSDMVGRKVPLYGGLILFAIGSVGSALATNIDVLVMFRFLQGLGAAAGTVIPRAVVRDLHTGVDAARLMSLLMLVFSISPILAPLSGSVLIDFFGWRGVFWAVLVAALVGIVLVATALKETRGAEARLESNLSSALRGYGRLLKDRYFMGLAAIGGFGIASFFVYLANSSFILIDHYGLTRSQYAVAFSVNAVSFFSVSQLNGVLGARFGLRRVMRVAVSGFAAVMLAMFAAVLMGHHSLWLIASFLFVGYGFLGLVIPTTAVLALEDHGEIAGTASALLGTLHFVIGGIAIGITGAFFDGSALPMIGGIAACAVTAFLLALIVFSRKTEPDTEAAIV
ncbi:multidrug effflux MFS transporter [Brucella pseudogrignonensis]|jgi:DHA1 family bicyclomycin/chloramphenicol resistance-like MFS transporter|uniref:Bcr/CflA family efflux transporter n=1 Tax=Brucella pseudogrignonensis TaxID=419475 RepID=A0A256GSV9_9HYPH|nr:MULTISPECIES: multidrug effflux MFS transporter [Brucella]EMG54202.1 Bcr/CflA subfamily drug resistance transporter [Ochrobactrum sp. CDB2]MQP39101.1 Bcr/CflA family efflux MFS transporter [Ochrobactrum sp. MYb237]KAB2691905.1 multidrug effflux MFS transporter [Brucella pseudogrignonensis]MCD4514147.1 multidrug effflux MFS transporter [Brucella pseudogrignonensis]NNV22414.1 Bcr/CflA family efflux MFS transporter [Brucella pseudogrignonensis]